MSKRFLNSVTTADGLINASRGKRGNAAHSKRWREADTGLEFREAPGVRRIPPLSMRSVNRRFFGARAVRLPRIRTLGAWLTSASTVLTACVCMAGQPSILVYTHNGLTLDGKKGYVHDNIAECVKAIQKIGAEKNITVVHSDDPGVFTNSELKNYRAIIFANSNNRAFDNEPERKAFQDYIRQGGGFLGIHSASGSERDWPWYWKLIGGSFAWHAPFQKFTVHVADHHNPATSFFQGDSWDWADEFYVMKEQPKGVHVLLDGNIKPLKGVGEKAKSLPDNIPLAWCHEFEGGRAFYTALGHKKEAYSGPTYVKHLTGAIEWVMGGGGR